MAKDASDDEKRVTPRRRIEGAHNGTRSGKDRRQNTNEGWPHFEKRTHPDRRAGADRRSGRDRREK